MNNYIDEAMKLYEEIVCYKGTQMKRLVLNAWNQLGNYYIKSCPNKSLECYLKAEEYIRYSKLQLSDDIISKLYLNISKLLIQR